jgi:Ca2+-binding RTX toxin-like protein
LETLWDAGGNDTLSAAQNSNPSLIDLRQGEKSTIGDTALNLTLALGVEIENAIGSSFDDQIQGNYLVNEIHGGDGNDVITGGRGDDMLTGGRGNDRFVWAVGDGNDVINEQALAGRDTIEIPNFPGADDLTDDLSFRLNGRDLIIDLALDRGSVEGSLTVTNQTWGGFRVESLEIGSQRIDLVNLVSQLAPGVEQFEILPTASDFGSLVAPI